VINKRLFIPYMGRRAFREFVTYWAIVVYVVVGVALAGAIHGPRATVRLVLFYGLLHAAVLIILLLLTGRLMRYIGKRRGAIETPPE